MQGESMDPADSFDPNPSGRYSEKTFRPKSGRKVTTHAIEGIRNKVETVGEVHGTSNRGRESDHIPQLPVRPTPHTQSSDRISHDEFLIMSKPKSKQPLPSGKCPGCGQLLENFDAGCGVCGWDCHLEAANNQPEPNCEILTKSEIIHRQLVSLGIPPAQVRYLTNQGGQ
jgi:hypothetical protein